MIKGSEIKKIVNDYSDVKIGVLGSHSALEVMMEQRMKILKLKYFVKREEKAHIKDLEGLQTRS